MGKPKPLNATDRTRLTRTKIEGRNVLQYWDPKKGKVIQSYTQIHLAWAASEKCNPHNLPPPNGQRATSDEENDENNKTDQNVPQLNQLVIQQDQQSSGSPGQQSPGSPGQQSPGSRGSEQTEQISRSPREEAVSPAAKLLELEAAANREWPSVSSPEASTPRPRKSTLNSGDERVSSVP